MENKKQTAVDWLLKQMGENGPSKWSQIFEEAREMEKQQIVDAIKFGDERGKLTTYLTSEEYYIETYAK